MFFARSASFLVMSKSLSASTVIEVSADRVHAVAVERAVLERVRGVADLGQVARGELVGVDDDVGAARAGRRGWPSAPPGSSRPARSGASPGVMMSWSAKCSWKARDAGQGAGGGPDLGREVGQRRQVVAERRGLGGEPVTGELHAVAGVAGEADDHPVELLHDLCHVPAALRRPARSRRVVLMRRGPLGRPRHRLDGLTASEAVDVDGFYGGYALVGAGRPRRRRRSSRWRSAPTGCCARRCPAARRC